jgi:threonine 3-dehydrogenase
VKAIAKTKPAPGADLIEVDEPATRPGHVRVRVTHTSICGTDYHIYKWDPWSASRIKPPRVLGHEFCGHVEALGEGVTGLALGDYVASESHITCGKCVQCRNGQGHVCANTRILGVDVDGCFAPYIVVPEANARKTDPSIPPEIATIQDPLGNAVHTTLAGPIEGRTVLVTGMGPIGLFSVGVAKACGATKVIGTEVSYYRLEMAKAMHADVLINPDEEDPVARVLQETDGVGVDVALEMSGNPTAFEQCVDATRAGGRVSMLGIFPMNLTVDMDKVIFKGLELQGIVGRRIWQTWDQMGELLASKRLNVEPVITHRLHYTEFNQAMDLISEGECGKVVFTVD